MITSSVKLARILRPVSRPVDVVPGRRYRLLGAHWYAEGLFGKGEKDGSEIRAPKLYRVEADDFVYNRLFAWKGAFAIATTAEQDCFVSNEFPCFRVDPELADARWLLFLFSQPPSWDEALGLSSGGTPTSRNRLKEEVFLEIEISLPSLTEQRRIVAMLNQFSARARSVSELNNDMVSALFGVPILMAHRPDLTRDKKEARGWTERSLAELVTESRSLRVVDEIASYPNLGIYSFGRGLFRKSPIEGARTSARELNRVRAGQFIYSRLFAFEGAFGMVEPEFDGYFVSNEYPTFDCNPDLALPEFLRAYFSSPAIWRELSAGSKGLGDRRQRVQPASLIAHRLLVPPMKVQEQLLRVVPLTRGALDLATAAASQFGALFKSVIYHSLRPDLAAPTPLE